LCRLFYLGPDLCIVAFALYISGVRDILIASPHPASGQLGSLQLGSSDLIRDVLGTLAVVVILLFGSILIWHATPDKKFKVRLRTRPANEETRANEAQQANETEPDVYEIEFFKTPVRLVFLHVVGLGLGLAAVYCVNRYVFGHLPVK